jgi:hypothetical protein
MLAQAMRLDSNATRHEPLETQAPDPFGWPHHGLVLHAQQAPPVPCRTQHAHDRHAVRAGGVENQMVFEIFDVPLANACKMEVLQRQRGAHHGLPR